MFITNSPAPSRINSAELQQRDVTVWEFAIFGYFPCIIRTVRTRSFNHKHKHRKMAIFCYFFLPFFLFLELGIFLFKLGKKHTFWHWEHDRISVVKTGQKKHCGLFSQTPCIHLGIPRRGVKIDNFFSYLTYVTAKYCMHRSRGGQRARTPPPGKAQVIWDSNGNKQLDPPPPPLEKMLEPLWNLGK